jgi:hypothetical protein
MADSLAGNQTNALIQAWWPLPGRSSASKVEAVSDYLNFVAECIGNLAPSEKKAANFRLPIIKKDGISEFVRSYRTRTS